MKKKLILFSIAFVSMIGIILFFLLRTPMNPQDVSKLESKYNISFSNTDIKQSKATMGQDIEDKLQFHVDDYKPFMENQFHGEIINFSEAEDLSSAQCKCKPYPQSIDSLQSRLSFLIIFQSADSGYDASLTSYYE